MPTPCVFCKIIDGQIPATIIHQDDHCLAFYDIHPKARIHLLIVPKEHIPTVADVPEEKEFLLGHLLLTANKLARQEKAVGYKLVFNVGKEAGQEVFHVHLHLMGN